MGFAMALGILIASLVVSSVLVPAITVLLGRHAFGASTKLTTKPLPERRRDSREPSEMPAGVGPG
jgi:uncharacterized membrane protein YdfJ with MMPL/SSD domain